MSEIEIGDILLQGLKQSSPNYGLWARYSLRMFL